MKKDSFGEVFIFMLALFASAWALVTIFNNI